MKNKYWFKRKRYGYGFVPSTWQGWVLTGVYLVAILVLGLIFDKDIEQVTKASDLYYFLGGLVLVSAVFFPLIFHFSPKAEWRWGKDERYNPEEDF